MCACVRACVRACGRACVRACGEEGPRVMCASVHMYDYVHYCVYVCVFQYV